MSAADRIRMMEAIVVALALALAGCAGGDATSSSPTATATTMTTPSPSVASIPWVASLVPTGERTLFIGTADCGFPDGLEETTEGQITTYTGKIACTVKTSDPRASGEETGEITMVYLDMPGFEVNKWWASGSWTFTTAGGSWRGTEGFGADVWDEAGAVRTTGTEGYVGEGANDGLTMRTLFAQGTSEPADAYIVVGWIEPAE